MHANGFAFPFIESVTVDSSGNGALTISGHNFWTTPTPTVTLADTALTVQSGSTATQIVANFPAQTPLSSFKTGSYFLNVTCGCTFATFDVALGSGQPSGQAVGTQIFTKSFSTSFTVPSAVNSVIVEAWGGGGGGSLFGGGGGGYLRAVIPVTAGESLTLTVGVGGSAGDATATSGGNGANTTLKRGSNTLLSANGGQGGGWSTGGPIGGNGGGPALSDPTATLLQGLGGGTALLTNGGAPPTQGIVGAGGSSITAGKDGLMIIQLSSTIS